MEPRNGRENGFTFVELVVALTVIAIGIVGVIGVMTSSIGVATMTNERSRAVALATRELERLRAVPYARLTVDAATVRTVEVVENTSFTIDRAVTWVAKGPVSRAYKQGTVAVTWADAAGAHTVDQVSYYYPGGLGPAGATTTTSPCSSAPNAPTGLTATAPAAPTGDTAIDLAWTPATTSVPAERWIVERSSDGFVTSQRISSTHPGASSSLRVDGLAMGTPYRFRVAASACGRVSEWSTAAGATSGSAAPTCEVGAPNVTPAQVRMANNGNASLSSSPVVTVNTSGSCSALSISYEHKAGTPARTQALTGSGGVLKATVSSSGPWDVGVHAVDLYAGTTKKGTVLLTVCAHNAGVCG
jgi:prepilin-type N-terminal cleavage/methylation domain-containing protein